MTIDSLISKASQILQIDMTPKAYIALWEKHKSLPLYKDEYGEEDENDSDFQRIDYFWKRLPNYLTARCPYCGYLNTERLDTYSLKNWGVAFPSSFFWGGPRNRMSDCEHFVGVRAYINLNNTEPTELKYYSGPPEIPYVSGSLLPDDPVSSAVIHSLPICRVENEAFIPRYLIFMITYFSLNPGEIYRRNIANWKPGMGRITNWMVLSRDSNPHLIDWVDQGKLYWLDLNDPKLPLKSKPDGDFPYRDISGSPHRITYRSPINIKN